MSWKMETLRRIYAKPHNNNRCSVVSCAQGIAQITLAPGNRFIRDMLFYEGNHTIWERSEKNSTYITEISLPALCLLLLIAGLRKTHWKDRLQRKTAGTPPFFMFLHVEPTRNNPMYNRYRHVLPGLNSLHTPGIGCKAPFFLPGYPVHLYLHIDPEDSLQ